MTPQTLAAAIGCPLARAQKWADPIAAAMSLYAIDSVARQSAFLAQIAHESGRLLYVRELWGPTPAQARYEGRVDLGNIQSGDGFRFRGRGLIQVTGRANYKRAGQELDADLVAHPELLERPDLAARSAAWFWHAHDCNELADAGNFSRITRVINGGQNGAKDRMELWQLAKLSLENGIEV